MSNLSEAIEYLGDAEEAVNTEAEIDETNFNMLLEIVDRIRQCKGDLEGLVEEE